MRQRWRLFDKTPSTRKPSNRICKRRLPRSTSDYSSGLPYDPLDDQLIHFVDRRTLTEICWLNLRTSNPLFTEIYSTLRSNSKRSPKPKTPNSKRTLEKANRWFANRRPSNGLNFALETATSDSNPIKTRFGRESNFKFAIYWALSVPLSKPKWD